MVYVRKTTQNVGKYSKLDKADDKSKSSSHKEGESPAKCWLYPQTKVRIISKDFKRGKYYNKKVRLRFIPSDQNKHAVFQPIRNRIKNAR